MADRTLRKDVSNCSDRRSWLRGPWAVSVACAGLLATDLAAGRAQEAMPSRQQDAQENRLPASPTREQAADADTLLAAAAAYYRAGEAVRARRIWERLAESGEPRALYDLATLYLKGEGGLPHDPARAQELLTRAAKAGEAHAAYRLALLLEERAREDDGTTRLEAIRWLAVAARAGEPRAAYRLALRYWNGDGLARDPILAVVWMTRAADQLPQAKDMLERMRAALSPAERAELARRHAAFGSDDPPASDSAIWRLQIVALADRTAVENVWRDLRRRAPDLVEGLEHWIVRSDLGERGVLYRLQIGPFIGRSAGERRCLALRTAGFDCFLVKADDAP
ncbi:MAG: hypothetical protein D6757_00105 [Alphaproteobacteria bacterium]|nr:MAG: hypothetical protein D6757_00105 [Alphaproteobacteria bacterium]